MVKFMPFKPSGRVFPGFTFLYQNRSIKLLRVLTPYPVTKLCICRQLIICTSNGDVVENIGGK